MELDNDGFVMADPPKFTPNVHNLCSLCFGLGTVKAMRKAKTIGGQDVRASDVTVRCPICSGRGYID